MSEDDQERPPTDAEPPPDEAFALVGHEIRAELIQELGKNELSLSEVRSRLAADVEPNQLHYHLKQLVGHFVEQTDDGYRLNNVGQRLSWTLRSGSLNRREEHMEVALDVACHYCQVQLEAIFENGKAAIVCPDCNHVYMSDYYAMPLSAFENEEAAFAHYTDYMVLRNLSLGRGICPNCANSLTAEVYSLEVDHNRNMNIDHTCASCGASWWQSLGMALLADPKLIEFCYDHGVEILSTPHWELKFAATDKYVTVRSTDPLEVALAVTFDADTLELIVDGDLNVVERNRLDAPDRDEVSLPDKEACLEHLRRQRWPDGVTCPHCDSVDTIKKGKSKTDVQRYRCHTCDTIFNDLTGTIFAEHNLSLPEMLHIIREMGEAKTARIVRQLNRSYPAILNFMDEVRDARDADTEFELVEFGETDAITASLEENRSE